MHTIMNYYSTNNHNLEVPLQGALEKGIADDKGLYMPEHIPSLPKAFFKNISNMSLQEISFVIANTLFGSDVDSDVLKDIVYDSLNFDIPLEYITGNIFGLELFHGPTLTFKDVGTRFMARLHGYFYTKNHEKKPINVLAATSGDTGSAVANGFFGVKGVNVFVLYPRDAVNDIQKSQIATLGENIKAIEVNGTIDDCRTLIRNAFNDAELKKEVKLNSANSINIARMLPQMFYYFYAYALLMRRGQPLDKIVVSVPCGNFGNLCSALIAKAMGLPIYRFIAANNCNDTFHRYLKTGKYEPMPPISTIAPAIDIGAPANFARILDLYNGSHDAICRDISGCSYSDIEIAQTMRETFRNHGYMLDPHGAVAYRALLDGMDDDEMGIFLGTAHPAKFKSIVEPIIGAEIAIPDQLASFMSRPQRNITINASYSAFKKIILSNN